MVDIPQKIKQLPYNPEILFQGICAIKPKTYVHVKNLNIDILNSIIDNKIAKKRKQPKCLLIDKEINKCDMHRVEYYLDEKE